MREKAWFTPLLGVTGLAVVATGLIGSPAQADSDSGESVVSVVVSDAVTLTGLTEAFSLTGAAGKMTDVGEATMNVTTSNPGGYVITVEAATETLVGAISTNTDVISTNAIQINGAEQAGTFANLTFGTPLAAAMREEASGQGGEAVGIQFRLTIPVVEPDTYSGTLNFVVTTL